jgi:hypothetical protein
MVERDPSAAWSRFLAAEAAGRADEAEAALAAWFAATPRPAPASGFAGRVMARLAQRSLFARRPVRLGVAAALALAALSAALVAPMVLPLAGLVSVSDLVRLGSGAFARLAVFVASGLSGWELLAGVVGAVGRALLAPAALPFVAAQFAVATLALGGLLRLASHSRRSNHAALR